MATIATMRAEMERLRRTASARTDDAPPKPIKLHKAQEDFAASSALFRGFVGGISSGKSFALCYDLLRRAKPGRLYMVVAPTFCQLSDSTFRSFLYVGEQMSLIVRDSIKRSPPPSLRLVNGAEVLFRSADVPDRLYGPNLSGVALDEAS